MKYKLVSPLIFTVAILFEQLELARKLFKENGVHVKHFMLHMMTNS